MKTFFLFTLLILFFPFVAKSSNELLLADNTAFNQLRPRIGPIFSMNFLTMDFISYRDFNKQVRMQYPEKFRGFSFGIMSEIPYPKHEHIFSMVFDASIDYMPTFLIETHFVDGARYEIRNEFTNICASIQAGALVRVAETGLKVGGGIGLGYVSSSKNSFVTLDSIVREEIANNELTVIEYKSDRKTAEVNSKFDYVTKPIRVPVFFVVGYEFQGNKFSLFPYFRFNYSIFAQGSFGSYNFTVSAYQAGVSLMFPLKK